MEAEHDDELAELTAVQGDMEAQILRGVLEAEGIPSLIKGGVAQAHLPLTADGLGELKIYVQRKHLERARITIKEYREGG